MKKHDKQSQKKSPVKMESKRPGGLVVKTHVRAGGIVANHNLIMR
jgi:septum formation inhibitor MinC